jgi:hypothetical protein
MCLDSQSMDGARKFGRQQQIYHTVAIDPGLPLECLGYDINPEVRFAAGPVTRVALMQMGFVDNVEALGNESFAQLLCNSVFGVHDLCNIARYSFRSITVSIAIQHRVDV